MKLRTMRQACLVILCMATATPSALAQTRLAPADKQEARQNYRKATAAYGLGNYEEAAAYYEKAFSLVADQALLYNAAQAQRLADNKARAALLYRNYLRIFPQGSRREDALRHAEGLERALKEASLAEKEVAQKDVAAKSDQGGASRNPTVPAPLPREATGITQTPAAQRGKPPGAHFEPVTSVQARPIKERSLWKSPWLWGGVAAVILTSGALIAVASGDSYPEATLGSLGPASQEGE